MVAVVKIIQAFTFDENICMRADAFTPSDIGYRRLTGCDSDDTYYLIRQFSQITIVQRRYNTLTKEQSGRNSSSDHGIRALFDETLPSCARNVSSTETHVIFIRSNIKMMHP